MQHPGHHAPDALAASARSEGITHQAGLQVHLLRMRCRISVVLFLPTCNKALCNASSRSCKLTAASPVPLRLLASCRYTLAARPYLQHSICNDTRCTLLLGVPSALRMHAYVEKSSTPSTPTSLSHPKGLTLMCRLHNQTSPVWLLKSVSAAQSTPATLKLEATRPPPSPLRCFSWWTAISQSWLVHSSVKIDGCR